MCTLFARKHASPIRPAGRRHARRSESAQGILEFALIAPFLLIFIFVIVDFGIGINRRVIVTNAAREAARYAATGQSVAAIKQRVVEQSNGLVKLNASDTGAACNAGAVVCIKFYDVDDNPGLNPGDSVAVLVHYSYTWLSPIRAFSSALPTSLEMNACTDMRMEQVPAGATAEASGASPCQ